MIIIALLASLLPTIAYSARISISQSREIALSVRIYWMAVKSVPLDNLVRTVDWVPTT